MVSAHSYWLEITESVLKVVKSDERAWATVLGGHFEPLLVCQARAW